MGSSVIIGRVNAGVRKMHTTSSFCSDPSSPIRVTVALAATRRADTMLRRWVGAAVNATRRAATGRAAMRVESMEVAIATSL